MKMKWDLKSIVTMTVTIVMCVAFLGTLTAVLLGALAPTEGVALCVVQAFISAFNSVYAFFFSKRKEEKKEVDNEQSK